jgi:hypothetical protein
MHFFSFVLFENSIYCRNYVCKDKCLNWTRAIAENNVYSIDPGKFYTQVSCEKATFVSIIIGGYLTSITPKLRLKPFSAHVCTYWILIGLTYISNLPASTTTTTIFHSTVSNTCIVLGVLIPWAHYVFFTLHGLILLLEFRFLWYTHRRLCDKKGKGSHQEIFGYRIWCLNKVGFMESIFLTINDKKKLFKKASEEKIKGKSFDLWEGKKWRKKNWREKIISFFRKKQM